MSKDLESQLVIHVLYFLDFFLDSGTQQSYKRLYQTAPLVLIGVNCGDCTNSNSEISKKMQREWPIQSHLHPRRQHEETLRFMELIVRKYSIRML